jgi:hypothetical protein
VFVAKSPLQKSTSTFTTTSFKASVGRAATGVVSAQAYVVAWQSTDTQIISLRSVAAKLSKTTSLPSDPTATSGFTFSTDTSTNSGAAPTSGASGGASTPANHLSVGAIVGIAVGIVAIFLILTVAIVCMRRRKNRNESTSSKRSFFPCLSRKPKIQKYELDGTMAMKEMEDTKRFELDDKSSSSIPSELPASHTPHLNYVSPSSPSDPHDYNNSPDFAHSHQLGGRTAEPFSLLGAYNQNHPAYGNHMIQDSMKITPVSHTQHAGQQQHNPAQYSPQDFQMISPISDNRDRSSPEMGTVTSWGSSWWYAKNGSDKGSKDGGKPDTRSPSQNAPGGPNTYPPEK